MKKGLKNDQCVPYIRRREEFINKSKTIKGLAVTPGELTYFGALPEGYRSAVRQAEFIVFSYETPIAWYAPRPIITAEAVEEFLAGPGLDELEKFLTGEAEPPRDVFPVRVDAWEIPAVRYSITTTAHQGLLWDALAFEMTWRENPEHKTIPAADPHYEQTAYARTPYNKFEKVPCGTSRRGW